MADRVILAPARPDLAASVPRRSFITRVIALAAGSALFGRAGAAQAGTLVGQDPFVGEIGLVAFDFAPRGWALCNGQLLPISQNTALFSLLGTTYGGNGISTFALPDLRGRVPIHFGQGPGLTDRLLGEIGGQESVSLAVTEMPSHSHVARADGGTAVSDMPNGRYLARNPASIPAFGTGTAAALGAAAIDNTGGGQPHANVQPYLTLNFIIALQGVFPSRS